MERVRKKMGRFLKLISLEEALDRIRGSGWETPGVENVPISSSLGRVAHSDVAAKANFPGWNRSLVDGFAVKVEDCTGASETNPVALQANGIVEAGKSTFKGYQAGKCTEIYTGGIVPDDYDAVIMAEDCNVEGDIVAISSSPKQWANIEQAGEDLKQGQIIVKTSHRIKPWHITAMASSGVETVDVFERIRVGVISTGNELFAGAQGQVPNTTQNLIVNFLKGDFIEAYPAGIAHDDSGEIMELVGGALKKSHCVVVTGGTSLGGKDEVPEAMSGIAEVVFGGAMIRPGRTMTLYRSAGKPIFSISGVPVPSMLSFDLFFEEYLKAVTGIEEYRKTITARLSSNISNKAGYAGIYRVKLVADEGGEVAEVIRTHGTGSISSMLKSDGTLLIPGTVEGLEKGQTVRVKLFGDPI